MPRPSRAKLTWIVLGLALFVIAVGSLAIGDVSLSEADLRGPVLRLRGWRLGNSMLAGGALAVGGVLVQGLFRNPLASPSILGTSAGASLGGAIVLMAWSQLLAASVPDWLPTELLLPLGCVGGAFFALTLLVSLTGRRASAISVLLTGFILSSLFLSAGSLLLSLAQNRFELGRAIVAFSLGGVEAKASRHFALAFPMVIGATVMAMGWARHLDVMLSGQEEAQSLGVDVGQVRRWIIAWTATLTGAAVAVAGGLSFVGLIVPHALRPFVGAEHRRLLPAALVGGAAFVAAADVAIRLLPGRGQVPLGVVTSLIGAPLFLVLLRSAIREGSP